MAVTFIQNYGAGHVVLSRTINAQITYPQTWVGWIQVSSAWTAADKFVLTLLGATNGDGIFISLSDSSVGTNPPPADATYRINGSINDFVTTEQCQSDPVLFYDWVHVAVIWRGSGVSAIPTFIDIYINGVLQDSIVPTLGPTDIARYFSIGGYNGGTATTQAITDTCLVDVARFTVAVPDDEILELANGAHPNEIASWPSAIDYAPLVDAATKEVNDAGTGDYAYNSEPPTGEILDCPDSPFPPDPPPTPAELGGIPYFIERMDNRIWPTIEDAWCVDAGLRYPMPEPDAILVVSSAAGLQQITEYNIINGGSGYTAPIGQVIDLSGTGSGAAVSLGVSSGVITSATPVAYGTLYRHPELSVLDTTGVGAVIQPIITNTASLVTSTSSFTGSDVGSIIRVGGGKLEITTVSTVTTAVASIIVPITSTVPNDPNKTPVPASSGQWSMTAPTMTVSGLAHLAGLTAVALADGGVVTGLVVDDDGSVTLPVEATAITVGLGFVAQLQTMYLDLGGGPTVQTRRKDVTQVVVRVDGSRAPEVGLNQPDAAAQPNQAEIPWGVYPYTGMTPIRFRTVNTPAGLPDPLFSGDLDITNVFSTWDAKGQIAIQQTAPVPLGVTALVSWLKAGDTTGQ